MGNDQIKKDKIVSIHKMITYTDGEVEIIEVDENGQRKRNGMDDIFKSRVAIDSEEKKDIHPINLNSEEDDIDTEKILVEIRKNLDELMETEDDDEIISNHNNDVEIIGYEPSEHVENFIYLLDEIINIFMKEDYLNINLKLYSGEIISEAHEKVAIKRNINFNDIYESIDFYIPGREDLLRDLIFDFIGELIYKEEKDSFMIKTMLLLCYAKDTEDELCIDDFFKYLVKKIQLNEDPNINSIFYSEVQAI